jgi:thioesterase domain-containing protein
MYARKPVRSGRSRAKRHMKRASRIWKFFCLSPEQQRRSLRRNVAYYHWLFGIRFRSGTYLLLKKLRISVRPPKRLQDAFAVAIAQYKPGTFEGDALLYRASAGDGDDDPDPSMGWNLVTRRVTVERSEADHFGMLYEPYVDDLANSLNTYIEQWLRTSKHHK